MQQTLTTSESHAKPWPIHADVATEPGLRAEAERFIRACFAHAYGADVRQFLPTLLELRAQDRELLAVLGIRPATAPLFLECYLDVPIEVAIAQHTAEVVKRANVVEVGNLAVAAPGGARWLIAALTAYLKGTGTQWAVFTAVPSLRNSFARMGIDLVTLGDADVQRLPAVDRARWGRYYDTRPLVVAARVQQAHDALQLFVQGAMLREWLPLLGRAFLCGRHRAAGASLS